MKKGLYKFSVSLLALTCGGFTCVKKAPAQEILDVEKLNSLTGDKVTLQEVDTEGDDTIAIGDKLYKYTYLMPNGYTKTNTRLDDDLTEENTKNKVFKDIASTTLGGAINISSVFDNPIIADFIGNYATGGRVGYGGAIYNFGNIGDITGNFIGNYATGGNAGYGGAINNSGDIGDITGNFIGNYATGGNAGYGGAIDNSGNIGDITGNFIGNYATGSSEVTGGAINNPWYGTIGDIAGDFIGNYAESTDDLAVGGAIYSSYAGGIDDITGNFSRNYAIGKEGAKGGAIHNETSIGDITGNFTGNYAYSENGKATGGALSGNYLYLTNSSFYDNYAKGKEAFGGAIYNGWRLTVIADGGESVFSGNYVEIINDDGTTTKKSNAIYSDGRPVVLEAKNDGVIRIDDGILLRDCNMTITGGNESIEYGYKIKVSQ
ncbi:MAG: hypothetical protein E7018_06380, partial [Alphaproteobacteria bacterium]|nr:hypothetical protein [Alphaproteobacteria bacterium]